MFLLIKLPKRPPAAAPSKVDCMSPPIRLPATPPTAAPTMVLSVRPISAMAKGAAAMLVAANNEINSLRAFIMIPALC